MTETSKLSDNRKQRYKAFNSSLTRIMSNNNAHVLVGGDFNCGNIDWSTMQVPIEIEDPSIKCLQRPHLGSLHFVTLKSSSGRFVNFAFVSKRLRLGG